MNDEVSSNVEENDPWLPLADGGGVWLHDADAPAAPRPLRLRELAMRALTGDAGSSSFE